MLLQGMGCRQRRVPPPAALAGLAALAVAILAGPVAAVAAAPPSPPADSSCQPDKLTVYKMVMHTFWSRDRFPKHYPDWRPPAQWSKVIGEWIRAENTPAPPASLPRHPGGVVPPS